MPSDWFTRYSVFLALGSFLMFLNLKRPSWGLRRRSSMPNSFFYSFHKFAQRANFLKCCFRSFGGVWRGEVICVTCALPRGVLGGRAPSISAVWRRSAPNYCHLVVDYCEASLIILLTCTSLHSCMVPLRSCRCMLRLGKTNP